MDLKTNLSSVPLRLTDEERLLHGYLMSALNVCEYVNNVDLPEGPRDTRTVTELADVYQIMLSLLLSSAEVRDKVKGKLKKDAGGCNDLIGQMFEVGRRYKRMNPNRMRSEYGKLMWILMDASQRGGGKHTHAIIPVRTVGSLLADLGAEDVLRMDALGVATDPKGTPVSRQEAMEAIVAKYPEHRSSMELVVRSIDDANQCVHSCCVSLQKLMEWLEEFKKGGTGSDLAISNRHEGSCLTHSHSQQHQYVKETLTLWNIIQSNMMPLWGDVEDDLLDSSSSYSFRNTGQGFHRMQRAPRTGTSAHRCLAEAQRVMGGWVGSCVIHLGDRDVPNALTFIDKYSQVPRIVNPIVAVIENLERATSKYPGVQEYIQSVYGTTANARTAILRDFFRHGFDGSGDDGGSCIDGRLTSAWNWCSVLHKKDYYHIFLLCGFVSFDGAF